MISLNEFKTFVDEITKENGRLYKTAVLEKYKDDESVKYFLDFIYNPYITTGISDKKLNKKVESISLPACFETTDDAIFDYVKTNNTGTDKDIQILQAIRNFYIATELRPLFDAVITKNLQLGIDVKTINKVIPNLIPEFNIALSNKYFDNPSVIEGKEFAITTKIDGGRIVALKENGEVSFFTRAGQKYEGLVDLEAELQSIPEDNFMLDGELTLLDKGTLVSKEQYKETMKISRKDGIKHGLKMLVFDWLPISDFKAQDSTIPYCSRRVEAMKLLRNSDGSNRLTYFELLPLLYYGKDTSKISEILKKQVAAGNEGIMLNVGLAPYRFKRSSDLLKVKLFNDCDLKIIGFEEGTNKLVGTLGALILDYKGNKLKCGSGFSDEQRKEIWNNRNEYLGKIAEITYFEETENANGTKSLRFPIFKDARFDKTEPNY